VVRRARRSAHVRRAVDGRLVLIDVFCMDGAALYGAILEDAAEVHRQIPRERMRYALEIPYIARESSATEIRALKNAWARAESMSGISARLPRTHASRRTR